MAHTSPRVEEFFNHFHSPKDGKFSIGGSPGRYRSGPGKGLFSIAKTSKRGPKHSLLGFKPHARQSFSLSLPSDSPLQEFACHSKACAPPPAGRGGSDKGGNVSAVGNLMARSGRIGNGPPAGWGRDPTRSRPAQGLKGGGTARTGIATKYDGSQVKLAGHAVTGPKQPLYNRTTGRLNQKPVRQAFKQGMNEIIHPHKQDSKRTVLSGRKVKTSKAIAGRLVGHISSKGGADRAAFREGG